MTRWWWRWHDGDELLRWIHFLKWFDKPPDINLFGFKGSRVFIKVFIVAIWCVFVPRVTKVMIIGHYFLSCNDDFGWALGRSDWLSVAQGFLTISYFHSFFCFPPLVKLFSDFLWRVFSVIGSQVDQLSTLHLVSPGVHNGDRTDTQVTFLWNTLRFIQVL